MSVNSVTVDTEDWQGADSCTIGDVGGGLLGSEIVAGGFLYGDLTLPDDANKEICGRITYWPPGLDLRTDEDGGLTASANDGTYVAQYQLYVDYVATGPETPLSYTFGALSVAAAWTEGAEVFSASGTATAPAVTATIGWTEGAETLAASCSVAGSFTAAIGWTEGADTIAISGTVSAPASIAAAIGWTEGSDQIAMAGMSVNPVTGVASWMEGADVISVAMSGPITIVPNAHQIHIGSPRVRLYTGGQMSFSPKRAGETEIFTVDFVNMLAPGETIRTDAGHAPVWTATAAGSEDASPNAIVQGAASVSGSKVSTLLTAGLPGVRYAPICTAQTSLGQTLVLPEYGQGQLEVTL